jgi:hypothetical protein
MRGSMDNPNLSLSLAGLLLFMEIRATPPGMKVRGTVDGGRGDVSGTFACCSFPKTHSPLTLYKREEYTCNERTKHKGTSDCGI